MARALDCISSTDSDYIATEVSKASRREGGHPKGSAKRLVDSIPGKNHDGIVCDTKTNEWNRRDRTKLQQLAARRRSFCRCCNIQRSLRIVAEVPISLALPFGALPPQTQRRTDPTCGRKKMRSGRKWRRMVTRKASNMKKT